VKKLSALFWSEKYFRTLLDAHLAHFARSATPTTASFAISEMVASDQAFWPTFGLTAYLSGGSMCTILYTSESVDSDAKLAQEEHSCDETRETRSDGSLDHIASNLRIALVSCICSEMDTAG